MGLASSTGRCDSASTAATLGTGCQRACGTCGNARDEADGNVKLCDNWGEEEVGMQTGGQAVGLDYGFLGGWNGGANRGKARLVASPVYEPGSLVPVRGLDAVPADGPTLDDIYVLDPAPLGRGSYGEVTGATHQRTGARRAVKSVGKAGLRRYVTNVSGFVRREVDILRRLDHPNIVRLYEAFEDEASIYLVLELCDGGDLLERVAVSRDRMSERSAAGLLSQMLGSLQQLYLRGVVHRDLKPENFLFSHREPETEPLPPETAPIKLIDFGLSRRLTFEAGMRITPKIGTTEYMAPEAFAGRVSAALADRADMWSLGVVLHVIFIGHFPSPRLAEQTPEEYLSASCWSRISPQGRSMLGQLLRHDPASRPPVTVALKHPWLAAAGSAELPAKLIRAMPAAIRSFGSAPRLRRLALAAAAREVDDCDLARVRRLFQALELGCDGALSRPALERVAWAQGATGATALELARSFDAIDVDGSGAIDWSELVAVALGAAGAEEEPQLSRAGTNDDGTPQHSKIRDAPESDMPPLRDEVCWRAFDVLSQGTGTISGYALGVLFAPSEAEKAGINWKNARTSGGDTGGSEGMTANGAEVPRLVELDQMVREVEQGGTLNSAGFRRLLAEQ